MKNKLFLFVFLFIFFLWFDKVFAQNLKSISYSSSSSCESDVAKYNVEFPSWIRSSCVNENWQYFYYLCEKWEKNCFESKTLITNTQNKENKTNYEEKIKNYISKIDNLEQLKNLKNKIADLLVTFSDKPQILKLLNYIWYETELAIKNITNSSESNDSELNKKPIIENKPEKPVANKPAQKPVDNWNSTPPVTRPSIPPSNWNNTKSTPVFNTPTSNLQFSDTKISLNCRDTTSIASNWYIWNLRCWEQWGLDYWNAEIKKYWADKVKWSFNDAYKKDCPSWDYNYCHTKWLCSSWLYIPLTSSCVLNESKTTKIQLNCKDTESIASSWYTSKWRCWEQWGLDYWNAEIKKYWADKVKWSFNDAYKKDCPSWDYNSCHTKLLCDSWYVYLSLTNYCVKTWNTNVVSTPINWWLWVWTAWSDCVNGLKYRTRECNNPTPANWWADCSWNRKETISCSNNNIWNNDNKFWVTGYMPMYNHNWWNLPLRKQDYEMLTSILHFSMEPTFDWWLKWDDTQSSAIAVKNAHENNVPILIVLRSWDWVDNNKNWYMDFIDAMKPWNRSTFVKNIVNLVQKYDYDWVDIDFEPTYQNNTEQIKNETLQLFKPFVEELKKELSKVKTKHFWETPKLYSSIMPLADGANFKNIYNNFDQINLMVYDQSAPSYDNNAYFDSPIEASVGAWSIKKLLNEFTYPSITNKKKIWLWISLDYHCRMGSNISKIWWTKSSWTNNHKWIPPSDIESLWFNWVNKIWDDKAKMYWADFPNKFDFCTFNDPRWIKEKIKYAKNEWLWWIMIWNLALDFSDNRQKNAIKEWLIENWLHK